MAVDREFRDLIKNTSSKIGNTISDVLDSRLTTTMANVTSALKGDFVKVTSAVSSNVSDVIGPELSSITSSVVDTTKNLTSSVFGLFGENNEELEEAQKSNNFLSQIVQHFKDEEKRADREAGAKDKKRNFLNTLITSAVVALGLAVGGLAKAITLPFEVLYKGLLPFIKFIKWLGGIFSKIPAIKKLITSGSKVFDFFGDIGKTLLNVFKKGKGILSFFTDIGEKIGKLPIIGKFITDIIQKVVGLFRTFGRSFLAGFKILGWPLTILLGIIDFIKGFVGTEGTIVEKIKAGLGSALKGFFDLPIKVIGWLGDKLLSLFGIEIKGGLANLITSKLGGILSTVFDILIDVFSFMKDMITPFIEPAKAVFSFIGNNIAIYFKAIWGLLSSAGTVLKGLWDLFVNNDPSTLLAGFKGFFDTIVNFGKEMWNGIITFLSKIPFINKLIDVDKLKADIKEKNIEPVKSAPKSQEFENLNIDRLNTAKENAARRKEKEDSTTETKTTKTDSKGNVTIIQQTTQGGGGRGGDTQIPSEVDNYLLGLQVMGAS